MKRNKRSKGFDNQRKEFSFHLIHMERKKTQICIFFRQPLNCIFSRGLSTIGVRRGEIRVTVQNLTLESRERIDEGDRRTFAGRAILWAGEQKRGGGGVGESLVRARSLCRYFGWTRTNGCTIDESIRSA